MINIYLPSGNFRERNYIVEILFGEFLGLEFQVRVGKENCKVLLENGNELIIEDHFFSEFSNDLDYLEIENIPSKVEYVKADFVVEKDIPVIFGNSNLDISLSSIVCGIDIFASSFFMLTRWEEYVNTSRDNHNRFPVSASLAFKFGFLNRPVVNEYTELLWNMLDYLGLQQQRKQRNYSMTLTHDVDVLLRYRSLRSFLSEVGGDFIKRRAPLQGLSKLIEYGQIKPGVRKDPFDTFDYLMDVSERNGMKSNFFFMATGQSKYDNHYRLAGGATKRIIKNIKARGHLIGMHPTYNAYNDSLQFEQEKMELESVVGQEVVFGRQHYLRFGVPTTWQLWDDQGMEWDSTLTYAEKEGFRCGVCFEFSVFNVLTRQKLTLLEKPLIVMEASFIGYQPDVSPVRMEHKIEKLIKRVKKYNGNFVFLWHNSSFNTKQMDNYQSVFEKVLSNHERTVKGI